jgi:hypothetical protein
MPSHTYHPLILQRDFNEFMQKNINIIELGTPRLLKKE